MPLPDLTRSLQATCVWLLGFTLHSSAAEVAALVPAPLELVTQGELAFWLVSLAYYERLRSGLLGRRKTGHVLVYSLYVRHGQTRGLFPVRAETDLPGLEPWTAFPHTRALFSVDDDEAGSIEILLAQTEFPVQLRLDTRQRPRLPADSPFDSLSGAATFLQAPARYLTVTEAGTVVVSPVERASATRALRVVSVPVSSWAFLPEAVPEIAFELKEHACRWEKSA